MKTFTIELKKLLVPLVVQCMLMVGFVATGYGQVAELPILGYGGPWENSLPQGWSGNPGMDFEEELGSSAAGGSAGFDYGDDGHNLVIHFDSSPGELTYWLAFQFGTTFEGNEFHVLESTDGVSYTLVRNHTEIPLYNAVAKGANYAVNLNRDSRYVKFSYAVNNAGISVMLDDITLDAAVEGPEINIKQSGSNISSGGSFSFGTVGVNSTTLRSFVVENIGTSDLFLSGSPKVAITGADANQFVINETSTQGAVAAGEFTTFEISFKPTATGNKTATINIANNDSDENPYTIVLTGSVQEFEPKNIITNPTSGKIGSVVTITGENLGTITSVTFGGVLATEFTVVSDTEIKATVPQNAKTGLVRVTTGGGQFAESATFTVTSPFITGISPVSGTFDDIVIIAGANFATRPSVKFNGNNSVQVSASIIFSSTTEIHVKVPLNAITGPIHVTTNGETVQSNTFTVTAPTITAINPLASGKIGNQRTLVGTGFDVSSTVSFNGTPVPATDIVFISTKELSVKVPVGATTGPIGVTTAGRTGLSQTFTVLIPTIFVTGTLVEFETKLGTSSVAQNFQVSGINLDGNITVTAPEHFQISLDANSLSYGSTVTLTAINGSVTETPVYVKYNPTDRGIHSGVITSTSLNAVPQTIAVNGNSETTLTFSENNFSNFEAVVGTTSAAKQYKVRGKNIVTNVVVSVPAEFQISGNGFTWSTSTSLSPSSVEGADKTVFIRYRPNSAGNHGGNVVHTTEGATESFSISGTAEPALAITSLSPTSGIVGSTVQINGYRLNQGGTPTVTFGGGVAATVESASATAVTVTVPEGAQTGAISLTTTEGTVSSQSFTVLSTLVVSGTLEPFTTVMAQPSTAQFYTIEGTSLANVVTVTAPFNFQVSLSESTGFATSVQVEPVAGSIASTPIYVRYYPIDVTSNSGNVTNASAGVETMNVAVQGESTPIEGGAMPVEFVSFTHMQQKDGVLLEWKTATEKNNSHFEVEIAYDLANGFERIGRVESKVINSSVLTKYQYKHSFTSGGTRYYRLKQVDLDGTFAYSNVIAVETQVAEAVALVSVAPNPLNYNSKVFITALSEGKAVLRLSSMEGKQVYTKEAAVRKGDNEVQLPVYDQLSKGVYLLTVELNGTVHKVKVLKQ